MKLQFALATKVFTIVCLLNFYKSTFSLQKESLNFLETQEKSLTNISLLGVVDPNTFEKIIRKNDTFYELKSFIKTNTNQNYLVIKVQKENTKDEVYSFEGTFEQVINNDPEWKIFKSVEQIFTKIIKVNINDDKFKLTIENTEMIFQFVIDILGDPTPFRIKLFKEQGTQTDESLDMKIINDEFAALKAKISELEKKINNKEQEIFSFVSEFKEVPNTSNLDITYLQNGYSSEFDFEASKSGEIDISLELQCYIENQISEHFYGISIEFTSKSDPKQQTNFILYSQKYFFGAGSSFNYSPTGNVLYIKNSKTIKLLKGSYKANVKFSGGRYNNNGYNNYPKYSYISFCQRLIIKKIES